MIFYTNSAMPMPYACVCEESSARVMDTDALAAPRESVYKRVTFKPGLI